MKINLSTFPKSFLLFNYLLVFTASILLSSYNLSYAQYPERIEELTRKLEVLNKQLDACGSDIGCFNSKMGQILKYNSFQRKFNLCRKILIKTPKSSQRILQAICQRKMSSHHHLIKYLNPGLSTLWLCHLC